MSQLIEEQAAVSIMIGVSGTVSVAIPVFDPTLFPVVVARLEELKEWFKAMPVSKQ